MRKTLTAVAAAATIGVATVAAPTTADARWGWWGPALGAFAVGAIVGGALARPYYYGGGFRGGFSAPPHLSLPGYRCLPFPAPLRPPPFIPAPPPRAAFHRLPPPGRRPL